MANPLRVVASSKNLGVQKACFNKQFGVLKKKKNKSIQINVLLSRVATSTPSPKPSIYTMVLLPFHGFFASGQVSTNGVTC